MDVKGHASTVYPWDRSNTLLLPLAHRNDGFENPRPHLPVHLNFLLQSMLRLMHTGPLLHECSRLQTFRCVSLPLHMISQALFPREEKKKQILKIPSLIHCRSESICPLTLLSYPRPDPRPGDFVEVGGGLERWLAFLVCLKGKQRLRIYVIHPEGTAWMGKGFDAVLNIQKSRH